MNRRNLITRLAVFPPTGGEHRVLIDKLSIHIHPKGVRPLRSGTPSKAKALASAPEDAGDLRYTQVDRVPALLWQEVDPHASVKQFLGQPVTRRRPRLTQVVDLNPTRAVAGDLRARGRLPHRFRKEPDNCIDPRHVPAEEASRTVLGLVPRDSSGRVAPYIGIVSQLFDLSLTPDEVAIGVKEIELAWDVACSLAGWAPRAFWTGWEYVMARPNTDGEGPSFHSPALLKARGPKGEKYKLYPKAGGGRCAAPGVLRFEVSLSGYAIRTRLGRRLDLLHTAAFDRDLRELARQLYPLIVQVQESMSGDEMVALHLAFAALLPPDQRCAVEDILGALLCNGEFHNVGGRQVHLRMLRRLRDAGLVELKWRGHWKATELFHRTLRRTFRYIRDSGGDLVKS